MANDFKRGIRIYLETSDYGKGIESMVQATKKYEAELNRLTEESKKMTAAGKDSGKAWDDLQKKIKAHEKQLAKSQAAEADYRAKLQQTEKVLNNLSGSSYDELIAVQKQLQRETRKASRDTEDHAAKLTQLERVNKEVSKAQAEMNSNLGKNQGFFGRAADGFNRYFNVAITFIAGITGVSLAFRKLAEDVAHMDDVYSDVMKTTGLTKNEVLLLNDELKKMDTRTSREELNKLAAEAGKLGKESKQDILDFVDAGNQIRVSLGEDLGEDAIKNIGKMVGVFENSTTQLQNIGFKEQMLAAGSAINELGASSSANEDYLVQFAGRLGGVSKQAKIAMGDILGYASALDQDMQQVEMSATALQQFIMKILAEPGKFAKIAGMSVKEFNNLLANDTNQAIKIVLKSLNEKGGFQALIPIFDDMNLDGARAVGVLSSMAGSIAKIDEAQKIANKSMWEGTSITKEYNTKNNNLAAVLDKSKKEFQETALELGEKLNPILLTSVRGTTYLIKALVELPKWLKNNWQWIGALAVVMTAYTVSVNRARIAAALWYATEKIKVMWTNRATIAQTALNFVMSKNPIAFVITLIAGLVAAFITWYNSSIKVQAVMQGIFAAMKVVGSKLLSYWVGLWQLLSGAATLDPAQIKKSIQSFKNAFTGWGDDVAKAFNDAYNKRISQGIKAPEKPKTKPGPGKNPSGGNGSVTTSGFTPVDSGDEDPFEKELKRKEIKYKELQLELMEQRRTGLISEDEYNKKAINQQLMFLQEKMNLQLKYKKETVDTEIEISTQKTKLQEESDKAILKSIQDLQDSGIAALETGNQTKQNMLQDSLNRQVITEKEYNREIKKLAVEMLTAKIALAEASVKALETADFADKSVKDAAIKKANDDLLKLKGDLVKAQGDVAKDTAKEVEDNTKTVAEKMESIFGDSFSNIGKLFTTFTEGLNSLKKGDLKSWSDWGTAIGGIVQSALGAAQQISDQYFEYKASSLEADKQRELTNAGDNAEAREAINKKYAQKELDLKKKQSSADTVLKVAQAVAAGGLAIVQAFAQLGPIGGAIAAVLIGGITGLQISTILKQNEAIQNTTLESTTSGDSSVAAPKTGARVATPQAADGRWDVVGKDDGRTYRNVPYRGVARTGVVTTPTLVGEAGDELIVDNPTLRNIRMNAPEVLSTIKRLRVNQRADGNYSTVNGRNSGSEQSQTNTLYSMLIDMIAKNTALLAYLAEHGVDTVFVLDEFEKLKALRDKSRAKGSL